MARDAGDGLTSRVWQACVACRRKKVKCDGNNPCHNCSSREATCEYPGSNDNASSSRNYAMIFEARIQQLDTLCGRLEVLTGQLTSAIGNLPGDGSPTLASSTVLELEKVAHSLKTLPESTCSKRALSDVEPTDADNTSEFAIDLQPGHAIVESALNPQYNDELNDDELADEALSFDICYDPTVGKFGSLVPDSYGSLRFIGGATNKLLVEAVQSLTPAQSHPSNSPTIGNSEEHPHTNADKSCSLEIPLFVQGKRWRELPHLPKPEQLSLPPRYVSDMLIGLYFEQFHYTFPILYKPRFMEQYNIISSTQGKQIRDKSFLSVFFAVCACASSLIPSDRNSPSFSGLDYYENALLLHFSTTGEANLERVQCLGLLSMCCAGWNTLSSSWNFAGQAVRAAQDLGIHISELTQVSDDSVKGSRIAFLKSEISRRIWWSVYCLDRVTSICLGRPMAANDTDCRCALPLPAADEELEMACSQPERFIKRPVSALPLSGFLAFARLCQISGKIQSLQSPSRMASLGTPEGTRRAMRLVDIIQTSLDEWLSSLPDDIRFSANTLDRGPNLTMCVIMFIVHAGSLLSLYRTFSGDRVNMEFDQLEPQKQCISAARSCINAVELVRDLVPPSHYLAFCVHHLTISGLALLWMQDRAILKSDTDIQKCVQFLKDLEATWSGASRGRAIIEQILNSSTGNASGSVAEWRDSQAFALFQIPIPDLFSIDPQESGFSSLWDTSPSC